MAKRNMVPTVSVTVARPRDDKDEKKGMKLVTPPVGVAFSFDTDEIKQINDMHPGALRKPVDESKVDGADTPAQTGAAAQGADGTKTGDQGKPATEVKAGKDGKPAETASDVGANKGDGEDGKDGGSAAEDDDL